MRGGGSFSDLFGFSQPELIESVYNFNLPVLSAIGHQVDNPLLDLIADITTPTPSLAAQYIVDYNKKYISNLNNIKNNIRSTLLDTITYNRNNYIKLNEKLFITFNLLINFKNDLLNVIKSDIGNLIFKYSLLETKVNIDSQKINNKLNQITLFNKNKPINCEDLDNYIGHTIKLLCGGKKYKIKIIS